MATCLEMNPSHPGLEDDPWIGLGGGLEARLGALHREIRRRPGLENLDRISVAVYDAKSGDIHTFLESNIGQRPLERISDRLDHHPVLVLVARTGRPWIDNAVAPKPTPPSIDPTGSLARHGYRSRYVVRVQREQTL